jgi:hypothetical protein
VPERVKICCDLLVSRARARASVSVRGEERRGEEKKNEGLAENLRAAPLGPSQEIAATLGSDVFQQGDRVPCEA